MGTPMGHQEAKKRIKNFEEVTLGYTPEQAMAEAKRCIQCKNPLCRPGCPVEIDIPAFIDAIAKGDNELAIKILKETNNLPAVCGRVCPQEDQCEKACILNNKHDPISIGRLERYAADCAINSKHTLHRDGLARQPLGLFASWLQPPSP